MTSLYKICMRLYVLFVHRIVKAADERVIVTYNCMCMMYFLMEKRLQTSFWNRHYIKFSLRHGFKVFIVDVE